MPKLLTVKAAIIASIGNMNVANGYETDMSPSRVTAGTTLDGVPQAQQGAAEYPKCSVYRSGNGYEAGPSRRLSVETTFTLIFSVSRPYAPEEGDETPTLEDQIESLYNDIERWVDLNSQIGGADLVTLVAAADDQGTSTTEATFVAEIRVKYRRNMASEP